jgi:hypothetical protein
MSSEMAYQQTANSNIVDDAFTVQLSYVSFLVLHTHTHTHTLYTCTSATWTYTLDYTTVNGNEHHVLRLLLTSQCIIRPRLA